jgi:hypothetical protein
MPMRSCAVQAKSILPASDNYVARFASWFKTRYLEKHWLLIVKPGGLCKVRK